MAIHTVIAKQCSKHLMPGEKLLATVFSNPFFDSERRFCVTNQRILTLRIKLFSWQFFPLPLAQIRDLHHFLDEGIFKSSIVILRKGKECDRIRDVDKNDAREFLAALEYAVNQNLELIAQQTKTCPDCAEPVSLLAKRCKYCGYEF